MDFLEDLDRSRYGKFTIEIFNAILRDQLVNLQQQKNIHPCVTKSSCKEINNPTYNAEQNMHPCGTKPSPKEMDK